MKKLLYNLIFLTVMLLPAKVQAAEPPVVYVKNLVTYQPDIVPVHTSDTLKQITMDEFDMISKVVMAEAGNQAWEAQLYVACVIFNRVESEQFPNTIKEVIFQNKPQQQFCCIWDGGYDRAEPTDAVYEAVQYAIDEYRISRDVLFFTSNGYLSGYEEYTQIDDMYFSLWKEK